MPKILKFRRGTTQELSQLTGAEGELFVDLTKDALVVMDGVTQGGSTMQKELVSGTSIKTVNGQSLLGSGNITTPVTDISALATQSALQDGLAQKQILLVSGGNIKTINGTSLLGSGNISITTDLTGYATETYVSNQIQAVVGAAPAALNTLTELAAALGNDASYASTITNQLSTKQNTLVSGTSIKTINGTSLLGSGNIEIAAGSTYNQSLNTTNAPTFTGLTLTGAGGLLDSNGARVSNTYYNGTLLVGSNLTQTPVSILIGGAGPRSEWMFTPDGNLTLPAGGDILDSSGNSVLGVDLTGYTTQSYVTTAIAGKQNTLVSGTNVKTINGQSLLGSGDISTTVDLSSYATQSFVNTAVSSKQNTLVSGTNVKTINGEAILGSGDIEIAVDLTGYATETYVGNQIQAVVGAAPAALNTLTELAAALNNNANYAATITTALSTKANSADLATVATSGSYNDLTNKPTIPTTLTQLVNNAGYVVGTSLATVATSGSYNDLVNRPLIPTSVGQLTNDSGYATESYVTTAVSTAVSSKQNTLVSGTNVKTINGQSLLGSGDISTTVDLSSYATQSFVTTEIQAIVGAAPAALNTLTELAAALGNDANYVGTITTALSTKANSGDLAAVATSGSYNDLTNKPTVPTAVSQLTNDSEYVTSVALSGKQDVLVSGTNIKTINGQQITGSGNLVISQDLSSYATQSFVVSQVSNVSNTISGLATVASTGSYTDLTNKPSLATVATTGSYNDLSNKPNLSLVALTGSYADLNNRPNQDLNTNNNVNFASVSAQSGNFSGTVNADNFTLSGDAGTNNQIITFISGTGSRWRSLATINGQSLFSTDNITVSGSGGGSLDFGTFTSPAGFTLDMGAF